MPLTACAAIQFARGGTISTACHGFLAMGTLSSARIGNHSQRRTYRRCTRQGERLRYSEPGAELLDLPLSLIPGNSVALLDFSRQVFAITFRNLQIIVGKLSPLGFCLAG
jgi:hypothetical protein